MNIIRSFEHAFKRMEDKNWDCIYVAVDIHDTIFKGCYQEDEKYEWLGMAKEALQLLSEAPNIKLIMWSSSHLKDAVKYDKFFQNNHIIFDYFNCNPEVEDDSMASFGFKFYFNIGLDDKFGFEPDDWSDIYNFLLNKKQENN